MQKCSAKKLESIKFILWSPLLILLIFVTAVVWPLLKVVQTIVSCVIKINIGNEYNGLLKGSDLVMGCNIWQYSFPNILLVVEYNKTIAKKTVYEKIQIKISDIVQKMPLTESNLDEHELMRLLRKCSSKPLPLDGTALWDIQVGTQPLKWKRITESNVEYYPVLVRIHHGMTDGASLLKHFQSFFDEETNRNISKPDVFAHLQPNGLKTIWNHFRTVFLCTSALYTCLFLRGHDENDLHGKPFVKDALFQFFTDDDGIYLKKVKNIKRMHGNVSFSDILIAAYSASLNEYYQKYSPSCPESITIGIPVVTNYAQLIDIASGRINVKDIDMSNNFLSFQMYLPINISKDQDFNHESQAISRLNIIRKISTKMKSTTQHQFNYILVDKILGCLPAWAVQTFLTSIHYTTAGSFLPGPSKISFGNGAVAVSNCFFWIPHMMQLGIGFGTLTFNDQLQMGLSCNGQIDDQSRVDEILKNVCKHIDLIEQELESKKKK
ncbi:hypothetical protein FQR65_LT00821 [Abscondita terminalis]|nr:hypothetical protein FQR65_LT00821 [Abscondita terminalis]